MASSKSKYMDVAWLGNKRRIGHCDVTMWLSRAQISAVSRKINTTQVSTLGIKTQRRTQIMFYDLPGVVVSR
eukprot:scaffold225171_cov39-Prasinocladus_malaysianus.AAC.1